MLSFRLAALDLHKFVKLKNPPLAASPTFTAFVEQCLTGMVHALLSIP